MQNYMHIYISILLLMTISNCGGNNENKTTLVNQTLPANQWQANIFLPESNFKNKCINPRSGVNPANNYNFPDIQGTTLDENNYLRSYSNNTYLWYNEIVDRDPSLYSTQNYFDLLKATHDRFHFTYPTDEWLQLSQSGVSAGYGVTWAIISTEQNRIFVAYTEPNSPATSASVNLERGDEVIEIDGVDTNTSDNSAVSDALYPSKEGLSHSFKIKKRDSGEIKEITMTSGNITSTPVQNTKVINTETGKVGYFVFNDHIATAEEGLFDAITQLKSNDIDDLVLDLRYNSGGYLAIANQLTYMIAGPIAAAGMSFETMQFNDKHPSTNPITNEAISPIPFYTTTIGLSSLENNTQLPSLDLTVGSLGQNRVFIITGNDTCSASESIINSLIGLNVEVFQVGSVTCGKPYGFYPTDNCGTTYFTVQFKGVNAKGFGDYSEGFSPRNNANNTNMPAGCVIEDDLHHVLGDINEKRLAAALTFRSTNACPSNSLARSGLSQYSKTKQKITTNKSIWLSNKFIRETKYENNFP